MIGLETVDPALVSRYGVIDGKEIDGGVFLIRDLVEKPTPAEAPSNLAVAGRYVLTSEVFDYLERTPRGKNDELQLTDALRLLASDRAIYGVRCEGKRHDVGNKLDFIKTSVLFGLRRKDIGDSLSALDQRAGRRGCEPGARPPDPGRSGSRAPEVATRRSAPIEALWPFLAGAIVGAAGSVLLSALSSRKGLDLRLVRPPGDAARRVPDRAGAGPHGKRAVPRPTARKSGSTWATRSAPTTSPRP